MTLPNSVVDMFNGSLGQPEGGWPTKLQRIILHGKKPEVGRPGANLPPADLDLAAKTIAEQAESNNRTDLMSYLMYPDVFLKFAAARSEFGDLEVLPTPPFFYGLAEREEVSVELEPGKTLIIRLLTVGEARADGMRTVFFELNGQPRQVEVKDKSIKAVASIRPKVESGKPGQVGAPIPGAITTVYVQEGDEVEKGGRLLILEAMKMQTTVYAPISGTVKEVTVKARDSVEARDLLVAIE